MAWTMGPYFDSSLSNNCMAMAMPESNDQSKETLLAMLNSYQLPGMQGMGVSGKVGKRAYSYGMLDGYYTDDSYDDKVVESRSSAGFGRHGHRIEKKRRLTAEQVRSLEASFEWQNKLEPERKIKLAQQLGLQPRQVAVWFQNRRARWKTKELERIYDDLKDRYDAVTQEKEQLKTEVARLKGLLQCEKSVCTEQKEISEEEEGGDGDQSKHSVSDITEVLAGSFSPAMDSDDHHDSNNGSKVDEEDHQQSNSQFEECYGFEQDMAMYNYMLRNTFDESFNSFLWCTSDLPPNIL